MDSQYVSVKEIEDGIALITMQDTESRNTFSAGLTRGLMEAFAEVSTNERYRAVVLTGYGNYFASGGTQEDLLHLSEGGAKFSENDLYSLSLMCPIPVISAMQGHGIGGGFVMGLFADIPILGKECVYTANFMKYGFTPGMGATFILPKKLGIVVSEEMMLTAKTYRGEELRQRGIPLTVLPRTEVLEHAIELARELASKTRFSLVTLKSHLVSTLRKELPATIEKEVEMHDLTFRQPEVKDRINEFFGN